MLNLKVANKFLIKKTGILPNMSYTRFRNDSQKNIKPAKAMQVFCKMIIFLYFIIFFKSTVAAPYGFVYASPLRITVSSDSLISNTDPISSFNITNTSGKTAYAKISVSLVYNPGMKNKRTIPFEKVGDPKKFGIIVTPSKLIVPNNVTRQVSVINTLPTSILKKIDKDRVYEILVSSAEPRQKKVSAYKKKITKTGISLIPEYKIQYIVIPSKIDVENYKSIQLVNKNNNIKIKNISNSFIYITNIFACPDDVDINNLVRLRNINPFNFSSKVKRCNNLGGKTLFSDNKININKSSKKNFNYIVFINNFKHPILCKSSGKRCMVWQKNDAPSF